MTRRRRRTSLYRIAEILSIIAGILGIVFAILIIIGSAFDWGYFSNGLFYFIPNAIVSAILSIVFSILVLLVGLGSIFAHVRELIIGILVIVFSIFIPGIAALIGIIAGILFIIDDLA